MKTAVITSFAALSVLFAGTANAQMYTPHFFVGANIGFSTLEWQSEIKDAFSFMDLEDMNGIIGVEAGVKFDTPVDYYKFGFSLGYDYAFDSESAYEYVGVAEQTLETGFSFLNITFDNYIRLSQFADNDSLHALIGVGYSNVTGRADFCEVIYGISSDSVSNEESSGALLIKLGLMYSFTENLDLTGSINIYSLTDKDKLGIDSMSEFNVGIRYNF